MYKVKSFLGLMKEEEDISIEKYHEDADVKVILLGDSAVGKSKLMERFLEDDFNPRRVKYRFFVRI